MKGKAIKKCRSSKMKGHLLNVYEFLCTKLENINTEPKMDYDVFSFKSRVIVMSLLIQ